MRESCRVSTCLLKQKVCLRHQMSQTSSLHTSIKNESLFELIHFSSRDRFWSFEYTTSTNFTCNNDFFSLQLQNSHSSKVLSAAATFFFFFCVTPGTLNDNIRLKFFDVKQVCRSDLRYKNAGGVYVVPRERKYADAQWHHEITSIRNELYDRTIDK